MFSKPDQPAPAASRPASPNTGKSVFGSDLRITGDVTSTGTVEIHGVIDGTLSARGLIIGPEGEVKGTVSAETVEVKGRFEGRASTEHLTLRASANVQADVTYSAVSIESGAQIEGRFTKAKQG
ncbi:polymer-forming cytoskeletal protein [Gemmobacter aquarius]|uniref:Polymer-forming cytoskeletal protein n=1 Tax=Paragemmobacter aquarius TaxID=2169400 RepID=A0A2S0UK30_9RHOB|nr:polymer-forming cytoskeletal protein [Gemmobacter aquarius]AWB48169.1 polymer-forming cytoskeletal protein [Gemmobacter aquarius]